MKRSGLMRNILKNKKGVELTLNTVIISILVLLVLIVVIGFFLGGTGKMKSTVSNIFGQSMEGTDIDVALAQCGTWCDQTKSRPTGLQKSTSFCTHTFALDVNNNNNIDDNELSYKCYSDPLNVPCVTSDGKDVGTDICDQVESTGKK